MNIKKVTRKDVAERAGVSTATVSYVVNNGPRPVAAETRLKVEQAIEALGYYPNEVARNLSRRHTNTFGLMIPTSANPVFTALTDGLLSVLQKEDYLVLVCSSERSQEREIELARMLRAQQVEGVVIQPFYLPEITAVIEPLRQAQIPVVVIHPELPDMHCIMLDILLGSRLAMQHLISLGHQRIALLKRPTGSQPNEHRELAYRQSLAEAEITIDPGLIVECGWDYEDGFQAMNELLTRNPLPTAVFAHNDVMAQGAMHAIWQAGLSIPDDISVVGFDDIPSSAYTNPPLTTLRNPKREVGILAGELLLKLMKGEAIAPSTTTLKSALIVRASTALCLT